MEVYDGGTGVKFCERFSSKMLPVSEKSLSEYTDKAAHERYLSATFDSFGETFFFHTRIKVDQLPSLKLREMSGIVQLHLVILRALDHFSSQNFLWLCLVYRHSRLHNNTS